MNGMLIPTYRWGLLVSHFYQSFARVYPNLVTSAAADKAIVDNKSKVTESQLKTFLQLCWVKYVKARIEPG